MATHATRLVHAALSAGTTKDALAVQAMIADQFGARHPRPLGETWNNHGLMGAAGSFDIKLIEHVTNMQDAVTERFALQKHGAAEEIPYLTPHEAASDLFGAMTVADQSRLVTVTFRESDPPASKTKRLTAVFRDAGCGLATSDIARTIFRLGGSHKEGALYLQGAFGLGGAMTYRNAQAVVLVTRKDPPLLDPDQEDRITVAVVEWQLNTKGSTALYLVDGPWAEPGDVAEPWSCAAGECPEFEPGTYLALISYRVDGLQRQREGDERSFDVVANTRLYKPVLPVRFTNETARAERSTVLHGLSVRLQNAERHFERGEEVLPFTHSGRTYSIPIRYTLFEKPREPGGRDRFVARDHAVVFTSNGQVHHHWTPDDVRNKTRLNKVYNRVLVVVETDELPIHLRTSLFTADRNELVRGDAALRLEEHVRGVIEELLRDANDALVREGLRASSDEPTADIARRISRALTIKGFALTGGASGGAGATGAGRAGGGGGRVKQVPLLPDPTMLAGPDEIRAEIGRTRSVTFTVNAVDSFFDGRGQLSVTCDHPEIKTGREITVGKGLAGRVRVHIAVPDFVDPGTYNLRAVLDGWMRSAGGLGPTLEHTCKIEFVDEIPGSGVGGGKPVTGGIGNNGGPTEGANVALRWSDHEAEEGWNKITVGSIEQIAASMLAESRQEYAELASLGDVRIPTVVLNQEYPHFKRYLESRNQNLATLERPRETYAVGVGVSLLILEEKIESLRRSGAKLPSEEVIAEAQHAAARGILAVMPKFDELAREAGLTS